jgi:hypothetical protein
MRSSRSRRGSAELGCCWAIHKLRHGARYRFCIGNARRRTASAPCPACRVGGSLTLIAQRELARRTARTAGPSRALWCLVRKSSNDACPVSRAGIPHHPLWTIRRARSRLGYRMVTTGAPRARRRHTKQVMPRGRRGVTMTRLPTVGRNELRLIRVGRFPRCYTLNAPLVLGAALAPAFVGTFVGLVRSSPAGPGRPRSRDSAPSSPSRWDCCRPAVISSSFENRSERPRRVGRAASGGRRSFRRGDAMTVVGRNRRSGPISTCHRRDNA